ncbi:MAG TPA: proton-conducting transporter membrane subunit [Planctomycetaceae bacterium]|nr:proton-conducting transporter membrane subunit [Planctomycetaceae bacterium]
MVNAIAIVPALIVALAGVAILVLGRAFRFARLDWVLCGVALLAAAITLALARPEPLPDPPARPSVSAMTLDSLARGTAWLALLLGTTCSVLTAIGSSRGFSGRQAFVLLSLGGVLLACVANDFVGVIIGVPLSALAICAQQFFEAETPEDRWAAAQSLVLNALAAACLVTGALLVSALAGTTNFSELRAVPAHAAPASDHFAAHGTRALPLAGEVGYVLLLAGFGIPLLVAPFQVGAAEVFEGATPWSLAAMTVLPRCAALVAMIRVFAEGMTRYLSTAQTALTAVALVTLLIGGSLAYWQSSLRRLLGMIVMAQGGLILLALAAACSETARPDAVRWIDLQVPGGAGAAWLLFAADSVGFLGLAAILSGLERSHHGADNLDEFSRLLRRERVTAFAAMLLLLELAGIPPFPGFWARVAVLRSVLSVSFSPENDFLPHQNTGYVLFALLSVAAWIAVAAPCLRIATHLLFDDAPSEVGVESDLALPTAGSRGRGGLRLGAALAAAVVVWGFVPSLGPQLAARVTFSNRDGAVLAAHEPPAPVKKHRRARAGDSD